MGFGQTCSAEEGHGEGHGNGPLEAKELAEALEAKELAEALD